MSSLDARALALWTARRYMGEIYQWGGESDDEGGYDCSGLMHAVLSRVARAFPQLHDGVRRTAAALDDYYHAKGCALLTREPELKPGCLVFYERTGTGVYHVAMHLYRVPDVLVSRHRRANVGPVAIEAGGAGSSAVSPREALLKSAGVRLSASDQHGGARWHARDPFEILERDDVPMWVT